MCAVRLNHSVGGLVLLADFELLINMDPGKQKQAMESDERDRAT